MPFDIPLPWEGDETEEERKRREELALAEAIAAEEGQTGERSPLRDVPIEPTQGVERTPDPIAEAAKQFFKPVTNVVGGAAGAVAELPWSMAAGAIAVPSAIDRTIGDANRMSARGTMRPGWMPPADRSQDVTPEWLLAQGKGADRTIKEALGLSTDPEGYAYLEQTLGKSILPAGKMTGVATGLATGVNVLADYFRKPPEGTEVSLDEAQRGVIGEPQARPFEAPGWLSSAIMGTALAAQPNVRFARNQDQTTIETQGGPATISNAELYTLGGLVAASMGMIFAPKLYHALKTESAPKFRPVVDAPANTYAISTRTDLARTYDDANAGLLNLAQRAGVDPPTIRQLQLHFGIESRSAANVAADTAVMQGHMETGALTFRTRVPLGELNRVDNPQLSRYAHLWDTGDDISIMEAGGKHQAALAAAAKGTAPAPGPVTVRGMTMKDVTSEIAAMEAANPQLRVIHTQYRNYMRDVRRFEASGEYATMTVEEARARNSGNYGTKPGQTLKAGPNEVPFVEPRTLGDPLERGLFTETAGYVTRARIKERMHNEVVGQYVDAVINATNTRNMGAHGQIGHNQPPQSMGPQLFTQVTEADLKANPRWRNNTVTFYRRGEKEMYVTDPFIADTLKLDPYYFQGQAANAVFAAKRMLEMGATGQLAPWFVVTNATRNYLISKFTTPMGASTNPVMRWFDRPDTTGTAMYKPGILSSLYAIPRQFIPQTSRAIAQGLDRGSAGWLTRLWGQGNTNALSTRLAHVYDNSLLKILEAAGTHRGSIHQQQQQAINGMTQYVKSMTPGPMKAIWTAYHNLLNAGHNASSFAMAGKNLGRGRNWYGGRTTQTRSTPEVALEARRLTGDPRMAGQFFVGGRTRGGAPQPIRLEGLSGASAVRAYGHLTEGIGRQSIPWFNATTAGIKRMGQAYLDNPLRFTMNAWKYIILPASASYLMSRALGNDPNGLSYVDYQMNRRNDYTKTMNIYVPKPFRPAEEGFEIPIFHEVAIFSRLAQSAMDHAFRSARFSESEDFMRTLGSILDIAIMPPMPPFYTAALATQGITAPSAGGVFTGEAGYRRRNDPYDSSKSGLSPKIEMIIRAFGGGIADVGASGIAAFTQTKNEIDGNAWHNAVKEMGARVVRRTPFLRDVLGMYPPAAGNTDTTKALFEKRAVIDQLNKYYQRWGLEGEADIKIKPGSKGGQIEAERRLAEQGDVLGGAPLSPTRVGMGQDKPTNPLYVESMGMLWSKFRKDAPVTDPSTMPGRDDLIDPRTGDTLSQTRGAKLSREKRLQAAQERWQAAIDDGGGPMGYKSLWNRYTHASAQIQDIQKVNAGNFATWQQRLMKRDPWHTLDELVKNNVDLDNPIAVKNFYERVRQDTGRTILHAMKEVEDILSKKYGRPIKFEDLNPHVKPSWYGNVNDILSESLSFGVP